MINWNAVAVKTRPKPGEKLLSFESSSFCSYLRVTSLATTWNEGNEEKDYHEILYGTAALKKKKKQYLSRSVNK